MVDFLPYRIAVGGEACRTCETCELFIDRQTLSEVGFSFGRKIREGAKVVEDPTEGTLRSHLFRIPRGRPVQIISSMQGDYSLTTVPKIIAYLRELGYAVSLKLQAIPEEIREHVGAISIELLPDVGNLNTPKVFVSYSWESESHISWVADLSKRLRGDGADVKLDAWEVHPGDHITHFMERAIRDNDFVLLVCTPDYKQRSDNRLGGVGYEGTIMTAEALAYGNARKFVPILCRGEWQDAAPTWLLGKVFIDLRPNAFPDGYKRLLLTLFHEIQGPPPLGRRSA